MKNSLNFLIEANKLKEIPRTGWVLMKVKNPETIAEHIFRVVISAWVLGYLKKFNEKKLVKLALIHDIVETYAGDKTPFLYWEGLDRKKTEDEEVLLRGVRLSKEEKERRGEIKFQNEKNSLLKLTSFLNPSLGNEIFLLWFDYEKRISREGKFTKQIDRIETLIQSIEYFGSKKITGGTSWWEGTEEIVEDPMLLDFLHIIQNKFYGKNFPKNKELENILDFLLEIGKLKRMPRMYWILRGIKNPETVAGHIFTLTLMALIFGREKKQLNQEKLLKMALCHEITAICTGDTIPYYLDLPKSQKERNEVFKKLPRLLKEQKAKKFFIDYKAEKIAIKKITSKLDSSLRNEIIKLWEEYRTKSSPEGSFLSQLNVLAALLQGLLYQKKDKNFSVGALWEWAFEVCDDPLCIQLMDEMKRKLHRK
ncbi:MAG: HD domain-containing protein [Candidatus Pacebacteria bacterium]|nr:HD domain-containing protein [Candidatus Paceibacterota bacterium]